MATRPDLTRGRLTPATEDLDALTANGQHPTVLAFALGCRPGRVVYEILNQLEPPTFVYQADDAVTVNRALDDAGFQPPAWPGAVQVPHDADWPARIAGLLRASQCRPVASGRWPAGPGALVLSSPVILAERSVVHAPAPSARHVPARRAHRARATARPARR
jgi:hypothetical protein